MRTTRGAAVALAAAALLSTGSLLTGCGSSSEPATAVASVEGTRRLGVDAFAALVAAPGTVLLDVRTPEEFATGHLAGARLVNFEAADFDAQLAGLDKGATYAIYCRSGNRSGQALDRMAAAGFTRVADLSGGISAWTGAGRPLTS